MTTHCSDHAPVAHHRSNQLGERVALSLLLALATGTEKSPTQISFLRASATTADYAHDTVRNLAAVHGSVFLRPLE